VEVANRDSATQMTHLKRTDPFTAAVDACGAAGARLLLRLERPSGLRFPEHDLR
jgi:hypothetical protein